MSAPLSEQQLAEIAARAERVRAMKFVTGLNAACGHFDTPVERELYTLAATCWNALQAQLKDSDALLAEATRLRAQVDEMVHVAMGDRKVRLFDEVGEVQNVRTIADAQLARANTLDRLCREKSARVAELEAERHSTNEALDEAVTAIAEKGQQLAEMEAKLATARRDALTKAAKDLTELPLWFHADLHEDWETGVQEAAKRVQEMADRAAKAGEPA